MERQYLKSTLQSARKESTAPCIMGETGNQTTARLLNYWLNCQENGRGRGTTKKTLVAKEGGPQVKSYQIESSSPLLAGKVEDPSHSEDTSVAVLAG